MHAVAPPLSWTQMVNVLLPAGAEGVPARTPAEFSVSPSGSVPVDKDQVKPVPDPPVAVSVTPGYGLPTAPFGSEAGAIVMADFTVMVNCFVAV